MKAQRTSSPDSREAPRRPAQLSLRLAFGLIALFGLWLAALTEPVLSKALTRFRSPWQWDGGPALIMSRATDETGTAQPTREALIAEKGTRFAYHINGIEGWHVAPTNEVTNVHV